VDIHGQRYVGSVRLKRDIANWAEYPKRDAIGWIDARGIHYGRQGQRWCVSSRNVCFRRAGLTGKCYRSLKAAVEDMNRHVKW
jgi:hypothetical protein